MGVKDYSTTANNNTAIAGINIAENCPAGNLNNAQRQAMKDIRDYANDAEWFERGTGDGAVSPVYVSGTSFKFAGVDVTGAWHVGRRVKASGSSTGTIYGTIATSAFSTDTTITVTWDSGSLSNESLTVWLAINSAQNTSLPVASASAKGISELATTTEVLAAVDTARAVTPDALAALWEAGPAIASASTITIGDGGVFAITGTTTITDIDFATDRVGRSVWLIFQDALTLTHNATTLQLPGGANITTAAGDACLVQSLDGSENVHVPIYCRKSGKAVAETSPVLQRVRALDASTSFSTTTQIPEDDSKPQSSEGAECLTLAITPQRSNSVLEIEALIPLSSTGQRIGLALFKDSDTDSLAAVPYDDHGTSATITNPAMVKLSYKMTSGTTSQITFKLRAGPLSGSAGTVRMNQNSSGTRLFGGALYASMTITEYSA